MSCCSQAEIGAGEDNALVESYQQRFRNGRQKKDQSRGEKAFIAILKTVYCTAGYWVPSSCCYMYVLWLLCLSCFQLVYDLFTVFNCPNFDCRFLIDTKTHTNPMRKAQNAAYTLASIGGLFSYVFMIATLYVARNKKKNALGPTAIKKDISKSRLCTLVLLLVIIGTCYAASVSMFYYLVRNQISSRKFILLATGVGSQLITQWTGLVACFVFAGSSLALGAFSRDLETRIKAMETENVNSSIVMHQEFARIVSDTVDSFSLWFVFHWILYGLTTIVALVVVASHFGNEHNVIKEIYLCFFLGIHLFMFVFPCVCAAYITSTCNVKSMMIRKKKRTKEEKKSKEKGNEEYKEEYS
eukprot:gene17188-8729_t